MASVDTKETLEHWEFNVEYETEDDKENTNAINFKNKTDKDEKKIKEEIRKVIRQIVASVTFLPLLDCICSFDVSISLRHTYSMSEKEESFHTASAKAVLVEKKKRLASVEVLTNEEGEFWVKGKNHPDNIKVVTLSDD